MEHANIEQRDVVIDIVLIAVLTAFAFSLAYHPYYFGDEIFVHRMAIVHDYAFAGIFHDLTAYKPRLLLNVILSMLAKWEAQRWVLAVLVAGSMAWINVLLYVVVRYVFNADRLLAWLLVATVLTSRFCTMLYFDYASGLVEMLSAALMLSALLAAWLAWRNEFEWRFAAGALVAAVLCVLVHERYAAGLLAAGVVIALAEHARFSAERRMPVIVWALSLGVVPLLLFWVANTVLGSLPITTGSRGELVTFGVDTLWCVVTNAYNVFLGGNYGNEWLWGRINHLHPVGKFIGVGTAIGTAALATVIVSRKGVAPNGGWWAAGLASVAVALIAIASLPGSDVQDARWMFPAGILVALIGVISLKGAWRHVVVTVLLATNLFYLLMSSHDSNAHVYSSRAARSVAASLQGIAPGGRNGIVVGNSDDDSWTIGGGDMVDMGPRQGDTFSRLNLKSAIRIDPYVAKRGFVPALYDFGLAFDGFGPHRTSRYRLVSVDTALVIAGVSSVDNFPVKDVLGGAETWKEWNWNAQPDEVDGAVRLRPGTVGWRTIPAAGLDGRWLVYRARAEDGARVPMRLQINWHTKQPDNRFVSVTFQLVYPTDAWRSFAAFISVPPDADIGYVYANLHDGAKGVVDVKSVEIR